MIMNKYKVTIPFVCFVSVEVEAEDKEDAVDVAYDEASLQTFAGNGGWDKLIGVSSSNHTVEAGETLDWDGFEVEIEELDK